MFKKINHRFFFLHVSPFPTIFTLIFNFAKFLVLNNSQNMCMCCVCIKVVDLYLLSILCLGSAWISCMFCYRGVSVSHAQILDVGAWVALRATRNHLVTSRGPKVLSYNYNQATNIQTLQSLAIVYRYALLSCKFWLVSIIISSTILSDSRIAVCHCDWPVDYDSASQFGFLKVKLSLYLNAAVFLITICHSFFYYLSLCFCFVIMTWSFLSKKSQ